MVCGAGAGTYGPQYDLGEALTPVVGGTLMVFDVLNTFFGSPGPDVGVLGLGMVGSKITKKVSTLGDNWKPLDIMDLNNHNGCEVCARYIRKKIGGHIYTIKADAPVLGKYRGKNPGWDHHDVVVKDGRVYDGFGPAEGVPIEQFKKMFEYDDVINFGF